MRLFIAINFNDEVRKKLSSIQEQLKQYVFLGNFTSYENLHMTLVFLGEVSGSQVNMLQNLMEEVEAIPFELEINGIGCFKKNNSDIWWAKVLPTKELKSIYNQLIEQVSETGLKIDRSKFKPHITLAREVVLNQGCDTIAFSSQNAITTNISSIHLMKSEHVQGRLIYTEIYVKELV